MKTYATTNIRVPKEYLRRLKISALKENKSVSAILRELIEQYTKFPHQQKQKNSLSILEKYAVKTGNKKLASQIDRIVYDK
ncbi:MAG: hypothetical protein DDT18_01440 [Actinobacteria bacterium]|nr:hypothetical protein [Actinomycetota bacterium]